MVSATKIFQERTIALGPGHLLSKWQKGDMHGIQTYPIGIRNKDNVLMPELTRSLQQIHG